MESEIKGESAALAAAFLWACATVLYRRLGASILPLALNLYKGVIACFLLSFKHTSPGITLSLVSTSALFVLLIAAFRGEKATARSIMGALLAVFGVGLVFLK